MTADELEEVLDLIADRAPALCRHVGKLKIGEIEIELRMPEPAPPSDADLARQSALDKAIAERNRIPADPLDDPMTFPGGVVPRLPDRQREREDRERDEHEDDDE